MVKVTVRNTTTIDVKIQEGNAGVFTTKATLKPQRTFTLDLDPNATYREYVLIRLPDNTPLEPMFSSDDVTELKEITIREQDGDPKYCWEKVLRGQRPDKGRNQANNVQANSRDNGRTDQLNGGADPGVTTGGWLQKLKGFFK